MNVSTAKPTGEERTPGFNDAVRDLIRQVKGRGPMPGLVPLVLLNLVILLIRPQHNLPVLGQVFLLLALGLIPVPFVLPRLAALIKGPRQIQAMIAFLLLGAAWVPLAKNNFYAYSAFRDVAQQYLCYLFPIFLFLCTGTNIRKLIGTLCFIGIYLSLYGLTHSGTGPGAYLGDENDLCVALLSIMGLILVLMAQGRTKKSLYFCAVIIMFGGVASTMSRGGFVGFICMCGFAFLKSKAKAGLLAGAAVLLLIGAFLVPQDYWSEMSTIKNVNEGTASERKILWSIGLRIWSDPKNSVFGVGFNNAPMRMGDYEPAINKTETRKSYAGRALHSTFFQVLVDTGLFGLGVFAVIFYACFVESFRLNRKLERAERQMQGLLQRLRVYAQRAENPALSRDEPLPNYTVRWGTEDNQDEEEPPDTSVSRLVGALTRAESELAFSVTLLTGASASFAGAFGAGLFVSTLYYPPIWLVVVCTATFQLHARRILQASNAMLDAVRFEQPQEAQYVGFEEQRV